ncbi:MAG: hypothetical protein JJU20_08685 [Opitutales bacterium]|nr:hypothetical protein [Opitutales bacterium]
MIQIQEIAIHKMEMETRFPFRYGIAEMRRLPHVFVRVRVDISGVEVVGTAADHLPPRWFKKDPDQHPQDEIKEMFEVIRHAAKGAAGQKADHVFGWWRSAYATQMEWATEVGVPPLLAHFGVTLVERALIEASARAAGQHFQEHLLSGGLGFDPASVHPELKGFDWQATLGRPALRQVSLRHTVGLGDPVSREDILSEERVDDGLPQALDESIRAYGLTHFKVKLCGQLDADLERLAALNRCFEVHCKSGFRLSLDGNEQFPDMAAFAKDWEQLYRAVPMLREQLLFVEQPVLRTNALDAESGRIEGLAGDPVVIIDESDAGIESLPKALELGYRGCSHKNCKGVFKGLANRCLLTKREQTDPDSRPLLMSGEDLANVGPQALLQDLCVQAVLGIDDVERNGHHYFRGLSAFPNALNQRIVELHPDLYFSHPEGFASLQLRDGKLSIDSVNRAAFGVGAVWELDFAELDSVYV